MTSFVLTSWEALLNSAQNFIRPALIFAAIALVARGAAALHTARRASGEVRTNIFLFVFDIVIVAPLLALLLGATGSFMQANGVALLSPQAWSALPTWLVALIAIVAGDFIGYWRHRLEHTNALWPTHAIHHSDTAMTWTTGLRFHPLNRLTTALIDTSALVLLGFPPWALIANNLVRHYYGLFIHMNLAWTYGLLGRVFVSPAMHRWHHVRDAAGASANFATVFSVFDQAFRTHHAPGPCTVPLGVRDEIGSGALAQLVWPLRALLKYLRRHFVATEGRTRNPGAASAALYDSLGSGSRSARLRR